MTDDATGQARKAPRDPEYTGRQLILCRDSDANVTKALRDTAGLTLATSSDFSGGAVNVNRLGGADGVFLEQLGVVVASSAPDQTTRATATNGVIAVERERVVYAIGAAPERGPAGLGLPPRRSTGALSTMAVEDLVSVLAPNDVARVLAELDESVRTWGLVVTRVTESRRTGRGVRIAVLDTGVDLTHPDFANRSLATQSFIDGETVQDANAHGTHTAGTAVGLLNPGAPPRYGVAPDAEIYIGKVLGDSGSGTDGTVLAGMNWAVENRCRIISMSLGVAARHGERHSDVYEAAAVRGLNLNALMIAAAGNESERPGVINPVGHPANCPSVMAVGAVDSDMKIASFSVRSAENDGGRIDIVGPGVAVYSTKPMPVRYGRFDGTSMATPHVSGIAALYLEANPSLNARELWKKLTDTAKRLDLPVEDAGVGMVQAPV
jgi:subtilisin